MILLIISFHHIIHNCFRPQVKLSAQVGDAQILWAGPSCLAITVGDLSIRLWDLETSESYLLVPSQEESPKSPTRQAFICLAFCSVRGETFDA